MSTDQRSDAVVQARLVADRFELGELLGEGAHGVVYRAYDRLEGREVALKLTKTTAPRPHGTADEGAVLACLDHPNVVRLVLAGEDDEKPFLALELAAGLSLDRLLSERGQTPVAGSLSVLVGIVRALEAAHAIGIVHLDLKPANVMVGAEGPIDPESVKVLDFGLARLFGDEIQHAVGSMRYLAPEQTGLTGAPVDARADLYSLGVMAFELLAGRPPFLGDDAGSLAFAHLAEPPPDLAVLVPELDEGLAAIVARLLSKDPAERYQTARGLRRDLEEALLAHVSGRPVGVADRLGADQPLPRRARFVGRREQRAAVAVSLDDARGGHGAVFLLESDPGMGKTRLLEALALDAARAGAVVVTVRGGGETRPFEAVESALYRLTLLARDTRSGLSDTLRASIEDAVTLRVGATAPGAPAAESERARAVATRELARIVSAVASRETPVCVLVDDAHRIDSATREALTVLAADAGERPVVVVLAGRTAGSVELDEIVAAVDRRSLTHLDLGPITNEEVEALLGELLGGDGDAASELALVLGPRAQGNPLVLEGLIRDLVYSGAVVHEQGRFHVRLAEVEAQVSRTRPEQVLAARLGDLDEATLRILASAAELGGRTGVGELAPIHPEADVGEALARGEAVGLLSSPHATDGRRAFLHEEVRRSLAERVSTEEAQRLHRAVVDRLESETAGSPACAFELLRHLRAAGDEGRAAVVSLQVGRLALESSAPREAISAFEFALATPSLNAADRARAERGLADALAVAGRYGRASEAYERLLSETSAGTIERAELLRRLAWTEMRSGRIFASMAHQEAALRALGAGVPRSLLGTVVRGLVAAGWRSARNLLSGGGARPLLDARGALLVGILTEQAQNLYLADLTRCGCTHLRVLEYVERWAPSREMVEARAWEGLIAATLGLRERATRTTARAVELAAEAGDQATSALAMEFRGICHFYLGRLAEANEDLLAAVASHERSGDLMQLAITVCHLALVALERGQSEEAWAHARYVQRIARTSKDARARGWGRYLAAELAFSEGRLGEALRTGRDALVDLVESNDWVIESACRRVLGETHARRGRLSAAREELERACRLADRAPHPLSCPARPALALVLSRMLVEGRADSGVRRRAWRLVRRGVRDACKFPQVDDRAALARATLLRDGGDDDAADATLRAARERASRRGSARAVEALRTGVARPPVTSAPAPANELAQHAAPERSGSDTATSTSAERLTLTAILEAVRGVAEAQELDLVASRVVDAARRAFGVEQAVLLLRPEYSQGWEREEPRVEGLNLVLARDTLDAPLRLPASLVRQALDSGGRPAVAVEAVDDERLAGAASVARLGLRSAACAPLVAGSEVLGVLYVAHRHLARAFDEKDLDILLALAGMGAVAVTNLRLVKQLQGLRSSLERELAERARELDRSRQDLVHAEKMQALGELVAGVAHQLNNPIAVVRSSAEMLPEMIESMRRAYQRAQEALSGLPPEERALVVRDLEAIDADTEFDEAEAALLRTGEASLRVARIVDQLRVFARRAPGKPGPVDPVLSLERALAAVEHRIPAGVRLIRKLRPVPPVVMEPLALNQILEVLLLNALDAVGEAGEICVTTVVQGGEVRLVVRDTGLGVKPEHMGRVFEPFFTTKDVGRGTGLGLAIAYGLAVQAGGRIEIASHLGEGATFTVLLSCDPVADRDASA